MTLVNNVPGNSCRNPNSGKGDTKMNKTIREARDMGLDLLKPSKRDIEHGMELHADALVFESYGFAPRGTLDNDVLIDAMEAGASPAEISEIRENMSMTGAAIHPEQRAGCEEAWEASGVTAIFQNAGQEGQTPRIMMRRLAHFTYAADLLRGLIVRATMPDDIVAAKKQGKHCYYMMTNGVPLNQQWISIEEELQLIRVFFQLGVRMMHLTYNRRNMIGDGCGEKANAGLSDFGRAVVAEMNRVGVIADVAHSGWQTSLDAAKVSEKPMVASHSGCVSVHNHFRSKPDEVIRAIADTGGYIGIAAIPAFLGGAGDINAFLDHIDYVVKNFGADHVTIGMDVGYSLPHKEAQGREWPAKPPSREPWRSLWPTKAHSAPEWTQPRQKLSLAWTNWPLFTVGMVQRGYSDDDIRKILGGNVMRVARAAWDGREP